ncbi:penicillin acylase family protein [Nocardia pneumoniae]|uniref:penicillin acylase family protein n=1 Tax=Nocardia pneumoniae TaxID=228601 RepID=UPI0002DC691F|nr:penicillin acylase family protein [Nocardia pneumoniae]
MPTTTTHPIPGLTSSVEILIDRWGIPHIYAQSIDDLYFAQGYNAARDRLFQLDLWRRRGLGQLSEALGPEHVARDRAARLLLYRGDMDAEWRAYGSATQAAVTRFVAGINAYLDWLTENPADLPPEFARAGYLPARWAPEDLVRPRTHAPVFNLLSQVHRSLVAAAAGADSDLVRRHLIGGHRTAVPDGLNPNIPPEVLAPYLLATGQPPLPVPADAVEGSNCWALAAERTVTGRPLLASDPHRGYTAPSLRYIAHLSAPGLDVIGAGEPHMPGIALGHNGTAAFGFTVCPIDTEDLVVVDLGAEQLETVTETIAVKAAEPVTVELQFSRHGPVLHADRHRRLAYALRSTWFEPGTAPYFGSLDYLTATSWPEFDKALENWRAPGENHVYADIHGTIATRTAGLVPKRIGYDGLLPIPAHSRYRWDGFFGPADFARTVCPAGGFIASANEFNVPEGLPLPAYEWPAHDRYARIVQVLGRPSPHAQADSRALQNDLLSVTAREVVQCLRACATPKNEHAAAALELLRTWDAVLDVDSAAAALFETWWTRHLGPAVVRSVAPPAAVPLIPHPDPAAVHHWLRNPPSDQARDQLLHHTLQDAYTHLQQTLGHDQRQWSWGALHRNTQPHPLGDLDASWNIGPTPIGGSGSTVAAAMYHPADFSPFLGASFRMIIDVGAWDNSICVNTPGQSGDPSSPHYRDLHDLWRRGDYVPMLYSRAEIENHTEQRLRLEPLA